MNIEELRAAYDVAVHAADVAKGKAIRLQNEITAAQFELAAAQRAEEDALVAYAEASGIPRWRLVLLLTQSNFCSGSGDTTFVTGATA